MRLLFAALCLILLMPLLRAAFRLAPRAVTQHMTFSYAFAILLMIFITRYCRFQLRAATDDDCRRQLLSLILLLTLPLIAYITLSPCRYFHAMPLCHYYFAIFVITPPLMS